VIRLNKKRKDIENSHLKNLLII